MPDEESKLASFSATKNSTTSLGGHQSSLHSIHHELLELAAHSEASDKKKAGRLI